jgi:hypothetical protein
MAAKTSADLSATADPTGWQHAVSTVRGMPVPGVGSAVVVAIAEEPSRRRARSSRNFEEILPWMSKFCFDERRNRG